MTSYVKAVREAAAFIRNRCDSSGVSAWPGTAIILGTGLGHLADRIDTSVECRFADIPGFPTTTVASHEGRLLIGHLDGTPVAALQGRAHLYEGNSSLDVTFPVRVLGELGTDRLIISNAAGGMRDDMRRADLVLITDHINLMGRNPLEGPNVDEWGPRFPDMSEAYSKALRKLAQAAAADLDIPLKKGVYAGVVGPNLETAAEYRMLLTLGADVVGMSTVPEVLVARHMGMSVLGLSVVTDECQPDTLEEVLLEDVLAAAADAEPVLSRLVSDIIRRLPAES